MSISSRSIIKTSCLNYTTITNDAKYIACNTNVLESNADQETSVSNTPITYPNNSGSKRVKILEPPSTIVVLGGVGSEKINNLLTEKQSSSTSSLYSEEEEEVQVISRSGSDEAVPLHIDSICNTVDYSHKRKNNIKLSTNNDNNVDLNMVNISLSGVSPIIKTRRSRTISGGKSEDHFMTTQSGRV